MKKILIVQDNPIVAWDLEALISARGYAVVGPLRHVDLAAVQSCHVGVCGAVLDTRVGRDETWAVADLLRSRNVPFAFVTSLPGEKFPARFQDSPRVQKPYRADDLWSALTSALGGESVPARA